MKDWRAIAKASGIEVDNVEPLEALRYTGLLRTDVQQMELMEVA